MHFKNIRTPSHTWVAATVAVLTIALFVVFAFVKL
jgi:hypothetical protein